ncbi:hypothetical protein K474DRAFT_1500343 [Panus rudis PR-1116 ss-1]|nr:hypothetical protein K474DRAFT_1500343 [Panus rudis PR-1116 ss-1]
MATTLAISPIIPNFNPHSPIYPSSPIMNFPPTPQSPSLALRRGAMGLQISTAFKSSAAAARMSPCSPKNIHVQPHRNNLPRRRKVRKHITFFEVEEKLQEEKPVDTPGVPPVAQTQTEEKPELFGLGIHDAVPNATEPHLQELIPGLYLAFSNGDEALEQQPGYTAEKPYTHIVNIALNSEANNEKGAVSRMLEGRTQKLLVILPSSARTQGSERPGLGLTDAQLRVIRDFLGEALPYTLASQTDQSTIRVLLTSPYGRPTDAMCAVGCYLAHTSGREVENILRFVDEEEDFLSVWKGEVSEDEMGRAEKIARAWSWLSQIPRRQ